MSTSEIVERLLTAPGPLSTEDRRAAAARLDELERENAALREALKPFASEGARWHDSTTTPTEDEPLWISSYETRRSPDEAKFTLGDLRRARAALAGSGEK